MPGKPEYREYSLVFGWEVGFLGSDNRVEAEFKIREIFIGQLLCLSLCWAVVRDGELI